MKDKKNWWWFGRFSQHISNFVTISDDRTFPNIACGEDSEHRQYEVEDGSDFDFVFGGQSTLITKVGNSIYL